MRAKLPNKGLIDTLTSKFNIYYDIIGFLGRLIPIDKIVAKWKGRREEYQPLLGAKR